MAIYAIGAFFGEDASKQFHDLGVMGTGWKEPDAPELHQLIRSLKVGDLVYIKAFPPGSAEIIVKGIGIIVDGQIRTKQDTGDLVACGRNVRWLSTDEFQVPIPTEKNNVRRLILYEEHHPVVQAAILDRALPPA